MPRALVGLYVELQIDWAGEPNFSDHGSVLYYQKF